MLLTKIGVGLRHAVPALVKAKITHFTTALNAYFNSKMTALGIYTKGSTMSPFVNFAESTNFGRGTQLKIKGLIQKHLMRISPHLVNTNTEFFKADNDDHVADMCIESPILNLDINTAKWIAVNGTPYRGFQQEYGSSLGRDRIVKYLKLESQINLDRYIKKLNYFCRKYKVPLAFRIDETLEFIGAPDSMSNYDSNSRKVPKVKHIVKVNAYQVKWVRDIIKEGDLTDKDYANASKWSEASLTYVNIDSPLEFEQPEANLIKYMGEGIQIFNTLSRKASYDISAYTFRAAEST
jgi:hypothetical protein